MKNKFISYKLQRYFLFIPYLGFFLIVFTSIYNICKIKNRLFAVVYYLLLLVPCALFIVVALIILNCFILELVNLALKITLSFILLYIVFLCMAIACFGIEKGMIERFAKEDNLNNE